MPPKSLKRSLVEDLASMPGVTKSGLAEALRRMHAHGVLTTSIGEGTQAAVRNRLAQPLTDLRAAQSPYGPLIRPLPDFGSSTVEVVNPHAYLYHLAKVSDEFGDLLLDASVGGTKEVRIVLYMDSICPGNPLRPDKSRTTECLYWTIVDFPDHVLSSSVGWFVFSYKQPHLCILHANVGYDWANKQVHRAKKLRARRTF